MQHDHRFSVGAWASACVGAMLLACSSPGQVVFEDVSETAGVMGDVYTSFSRHSLGVIWFDANNDGLPDLLATNGFDLTGFDLQRPHLFLNAGSGVFERADDLLERLPNYEYPGGLAADYDKDGDVDVFLYTAHEAFSLQPGFINPLEGPPNVLLKNQLVETGELSFIDVATEVGLRDGMETGLRGLLDASSPYDCYQTRTAAFLDYDLDGWIDLYVGHMVSNRSGHQTDPMSDSIGRQANQDFLYRNNGDGTFSRVFGALRAGERTRRSALVVRSGHLNDDLWPDLYIGNVGKDLEVLFPENLDDGLLLNSGEGHFVASDAPIGDDTPAAMGIDFADINNDGLFDVYLSDVWVHVLNDETNIGNTLYLSDAESGYEDNSAPATGLAADLSWGVNFADFDLDGVEELFVGYSPGDSPIYDLADVAHGGSAGTEGILPTRNVRGSALADYDLDGDVDLAVVNEEGELQVFENRSERQGVPLVVRVKPWRSNRDGYGLLAELTLTNGDRMLRQLKGGSSAHSSDFPELWFGIPHGQTVSSLTVHWPLAGHPSQTIDGPLEGELIVDERDASCLCEFDGERGIGIVDLKEYLVGWFAGDPVTNLDGGRLDVNDLLLFLECWLDSEGAGCQP